MSTGNISWGGKSSQCIGLITLPPSCSNCLEIWEPQPLGTLRDCPGLSWDCFTFMYAIYVIKESEELKINKQTKYSK